MERPTKRGDCLEGVRPCPWFGCYWHIAHSQGCQKTFWKQDNDEIVDRVFSLAKTCVLDVADEGGATLEDIAILTDLTRERVRQIEGTGCSKGGALKRMRHSSRSRLLEGYYG